MLTPSVIQSVLDPALHDRVGLGEVLAGVDAEDVVGLEDGQGDDLAAHRLEQRGGVGQVVFALGVAGVEPVEGVPEAGQVEDVAARVDLADRLLLGGAVALLDDPEEPAGGVAEDPAEAGRVGDDRPSRAGRRRRSASLAGEQVGQRLGPDQRLVADEDQRRAPVAVQQRPAGLDGVAGAELPRPGWRRGRRARPPRAARTWSAP